MTPQDALREAFHYAVENGSVGLKQTDAMLAGVRRMDELEAALREIAYYPAEGWYPSDREEAFKGVKAIARRALGETP